MRGFSSRSIFEFALLILLIFFSSISIAYSFQSDELLHDDEEFGLEGGSGGGGGGRTLPDLEYLKPPTPTTRRRADLDSSFSGSPDSKSVQFSLEHALGDSGFSPAGTFTARLKTWSHGGQTLTKLRFSRNALTEDEKKEFERLLEEDGFYTIRLPSNVLNPPGREYVLSSVRARCLPRESLNEHIIIYTDGVNILSVNYGSAGPCQYPRLPKYPAKWSFNSYTILKTSEQAPRTPTFTEELLADENLLGEGVKPPERSFWAKYWMYLIPVGLMFMNFMTQVMNMPEEQAAGQALQPAAQRAPGATVRRR